MLFHAKDQPIGDADVERAAWVAGEDVNLVAEHGVPHVEIGSMLRDGSSGQARG